MFVDKSRYFLTKNLPYNIDFGLKLKKKKNWPLSNASYINNFF